MADDGNVKIDIWGTCVSRDIFGITGDPRFTVVNYLWSTSFVSAFHPRNTQLPEIEQSEIDDSSAFLRKMRCHEINKTALNVFDEPSEWLVVDLRSIAYGLEIYVLENNEEMIVTGNSKTQLNKVLNSRGIVYSSKSIPLTEVDYRSYFDRFVDFVTSRYRNIVLIEAREALLNIDVDGEKYYKDEEERRIVLDLEFELNIEFMKRTGCHVIKCPLDILSDDSHKWGVGPVHYSKEYYDYALDCLVDIVFGEKEGLERRLDIRYMGCTRLLNRKRLGIVEKPVINAPITQEQIDRALELIGSAKTKEDCVKVVNEVRSVATASKKVKSGMFDLLWKIDTFGSLKEMVSLVSPTETDPVLKGKMGKAYHYGKGITKDLDKAESLLSDAVSKGYQWAVLEMFDVLWEKGEYGRMVEVIDPMVSQKQPFAVARMARAYRYGKGVPQNTLKAKEYYLYAADHGVGWAEVELKEL